MTLFSEIYTVMFGGENRDHFFQLLDEVYRKLFHIKMITIREGWGRKCDLRFDDSDIPEIIDFLFCYTDVRA
jgi:hypothetical protein